MPSTPTIYRSTDASAPQLSGADGTLVAIFDACLVNGYGSKSAAGWSKPYSASNQGVYQPGSGVQHYFHVDDAHPNATSLQKEAQIRGSLTANGFLSSPGNDFFPTTSQISVGNGMMIRKSATIDSTVRAWTLIADDRTCYFFALSEGSASYAPASFGEFYSLHATQPDNYRSFVQGRKPNIGFALASGSPDSFIVGALNLKTGQHDQYLPLTYAGGGTPPTFGKNSFLGGSTTPGVLWCGASSWGLSGSDPVISGQVMSPVLIGEDGAGLRGISPGLAAGQLLGSAAADQDTIAGSGPYAGRTFLVLSSFYISSSGSSSTNGYILIDITGPWDRY